jgi:hypothetical protein
VSGFSGVTTGVTITMVSGYSGNVAQWNGTVVITDGVITSITP